MLGTKKIKGKKNSSFFVIVLKLNAQLIIKTINESPSKIFEYLETISTLENMVVIKSKP